MNNAERALVYLNRAVERFTSGRAGLLLQLGATQAALANLYFQRGMEERSDRFMNLAEASLREALAIEDSVLGHILLAEVLVGKDEDEAAEAELQQAKALNPTASEEVQIEADLGDIAMEREHYEEALRHFLRVAQLEPNHPGIWFRIGYAYRLLENYVDAESSFQRALEMDPQDILAYSELASVYMNTNRLSKAQETLEQGLRVNPDSAQLRALLASILIEKGNRRRAEELLKEAERINPDLELVRLVRQSLVGAGLAAAHKTKRR
jgi:tetratricopeptide (TPR) repeat protein